ncbi:hypothetical protein Tco_1553966 [Tanacetum coccineum]|uniref:Uncharacterized protein n=1 Tax=Tanacetum coccineum TaxID=301880 RepID=A0ABQ4WS39_9ASTR
MTTSDPCPQGRNVVPPVEKTDLSQQGLEFLFSPLLEEYYNPTHGQAEENNNDQATGMLSFKKSILSILLYTEIFPLELVRGIQPCAVQQGR